MFKKETPSSLPENAGEIKSYLASRTYPSILNI
jgi:hypothetical protein